jgi:transcriptional regulator with XRE-family HTH domain
VLLGVPLLENLIKKLSDHVGGERALSRLSGISKSSLSKIATGESDKLSPENLIRLAETTQHLLADGNPLRDEMGRDVVYSEIELIGLAFGLATPPTPVDLSPVAAFIRGILAAHGYNPFQKSTLGAGIDWFLGHCALSKLTPEVKEQRTQTIRLLIRGDIRIEPTDPILTTISRAISKIDGVPSITPLMLRSMLTDSPTEVEHVDEPCLTH